MGHKASARRHSELGEVSLNLNPMMDMFAVLIPGLLMMSVVVEVAAVNIYAPASGGSGSPEDMKKPDKMPLNFRVMITDDGYLISTRDGPMPGPGGTEPTITHPTIPVLQKTIPCTRYRATVPPPRSKNKDQPICDPNRPEEKRQFWVYDHHALRAVAQQLKDDNPDEKQVIIEGIPTVDYEPISDALDLTRDMVDGSGTVIPLFPEAVLGAGQP
jgi:hypothetical protein